MSRNISDAAELKAMKVGETCRVEAGMESEDRVGPHKPRYPVHFHVLRVPDGWLYTLCTTDGFGDPVVLNTTYVPELNPWEISNATK